MSSGLCQRFEASHAGQLRRGTMLDVDAAASLRCKRKDVRNEIPLVQTQSWSQWKRSIALPIDIPMLSNASAPFRTISLPPTIHSVKKKPNSSLDRKSSVVIAQYPSGLVGRSFSSTAGDSTVR
jgi:hypothetical protein